MSTLVDHEMKERAKLAYAKCSHSEWDDVVTAVLEAALSPFEAPPFVATDDELEALALMRSTLLDDPKAAKNLLVAAFDRACKTLGVSQAAPVASGEWTDDDYSKAIVAVQAFAMRQTSETYARAALDAVAYRLPPHDHAICVDAGAARGAEEALEDALERAQETIATLEAKLVAPLSDEEEALVSYCDDAWQGRTGNRANGLLAIIRARFPAPAVKSPGQVAFEAVWDDDAPAWAELHFSAHDAWEQRAAAVLAAHGAKP